MIPRHEDDGFLPAGIHVATWAEVVERFGGTPRRVMLLGRLLMALRHLAQAGCPAVYLGGSFVSTKPQPMDVDVVWEIDGVDPRRLDPAFHNTDGIETLRFIFAGDYFPTCLVEGETGLMFVEFFQINRNGKAVGVVMVDLATIANLHP